MIILFYKKKKNNGIVGRMLSVRSLFSDKKSIIDKAIDTNKT